LKRTKYDQGGPQKWLPNDKPQALMDLFRLYRWNGDVMYCRTCNRGIHFTRRKEQMHHASDCQGAGDLNPWELLHQCIAELPRELQYVAPESGA